ncbi:hypothetical protein ACFFKC_14765 [Pseudoduganella danionis]|uniref:Helix-turn-helix domain-containing protein n=1 Tax=Pseudoduganella danionis TaxID=1890295 RepID=A0ABW9SNJ6_9BURK|nr:hypothetical protein [Pseudoduganella danionis]MTW33154.1 hypothetical protein [Pseudoduganella danionis]
MDKGQSPLFAELTLGADTQDSTAQSGVKFTGTDNPRHLRVIHALMTRPRKREEIDRIAGASNGPELMAELRRRGISRKARRVPGIDRDGYPIKFGIYEFNDDDRRAVNAWLSKRNRKGS